MHREVRPSSSRSFSPAGGTRRVPLGLAGCLVVFIFTFVALSASAPQPLGSGRIGSVSYTAIVAAFTGVCSWTLVLLYHRVPRAAVRAATIFGAFIAWVLGSLVILGGTRQGLQFILVQVSFLGALLLASTARRVVGGRLDQAVARCVRVTAVVIIGSAILNLADSSLKTGVRPLAIVALLGLGWFLAEYRLGNRTSMWWAIAVLLGIGISLSRTALLTGFLLVLATVLSAPSRHRVRNVAIAALLVIGGYWSVVSWAPLHDRFVEGDVSLSIAGLDINAEGRTLVWSVLWSEAQSELLSGRGPGAASARSAVLEAGAFEQPHSDYLRLLYDFGLIGVGLFAWFLLRSGRLLRATRVRSPGSIAALAALNAGLAVLVVMTTDNPLDYPFVMIPLGALIGLGLGSGLGVSSPPQPATLAR